LVVRQILEHLVKLIGRVPRLKKYQKQLHVLSRLRKLTVITKNAIDAMPIHYDIETDELYLEGIEKGIEKGREEGRVQGIEQGIEKGIEKGVEEGVRLKAEENVINMLKREQFTLRDITEIINVSEEFVLEIAQRLGLKVIY
jgi:flagellar biosynthesis/type III secretory pathway protein FliH